MRLNPVKQLVKFDISNLELDGEIIIKIFLSLSSCLQILHINIIIDLKNRHII